MGPGPILLSMPRKLRLEFPGAMYHVMSRGDQREDIFLCDVDRYDFLSRICANLFGLVTACHDNHLPLVCWRGVSAGADDQTSEHFRKFASTYGGAGGKAVTKSLGPCPPIQIHRLLIRILTECSLSLQLAAQIKRGVSNRRLHAPRSGRSTLPRI